MIKFIGNYSSGEWYGDKEKIFVKVPDVTSVHHKLYPYLNAGLKIKIGSDEFNGCIESEKTSGYKSILVVVLNTPIDRNRLFSHANKDVEIGLEIKASEKKTKTYHNKGYVSKINKIIEAISNESGHTRKETKTLLEGQYSSYMGENYTIESLAVDEPDMLPDLLEYISDFAEDLGINVKGLLSETDSYLRKRRATNLCCVCTNGAIDTLSIYPLCLKHLEEATSMMKQKPNSWERSFKNKYALED